MRCEWKVSFQSQLIKQPVVVSLCVAVGVQQRWREMGKQTGPALAWVPGLPALGRCPGRPGAPAIWTSSPEQGGVSVVNGGRASAWLDTIWKGHLCPRAGPGKHGGTQSVAALCHLLPRVVGRAWEHSGPQEWGRRTIGWAAVPGLITVCKQSLLHKHLW